MLVEYVKDLQDKIASVLPIWRKRKQSSTAHFAPGIECSSSSALARTVQVIERKNTDLYDIHLLKWWIEPLPHVSVLAVLSPSGREQVQHREHLMADQYQELKELVD